MHGCLGATRGVPAALAARPRVALRAPRSSFLRPRGVPPRAAPRRCFAAARRDDERGDTAGEKSWGELATQAGELARQTLRKILPAALTKKEDSKPPVRVVREDAEPDVSALLRPLLGDGLLGRAAGSLLGKGLKAVASQLRSAAAASEEAHAAASALVERDARVSAALGAPLRCSAPSSVSQSSSSINGVTSTSIQLGFMVQGSSGRVAPVEVDSSNGRLVARVRLPTGDITLTGGSGGGSAGGRRAAGDGTIIDVDAADYRVR